MEGTKLSMLKRFREAAFNSPFQKVIMRRAIALRGTQRTASSGIEVDKVFDGVGSRDGSVD
jgi:hypothetical protein